MSTRLVAIVPAGNTIETTVAAMNAMQGVYVDALQVTRDFENGDLLIVRSVDDPTGSGSDVSALTKAAKKTAKKAVAAQAKHDMQITIEMGTGEPGSEAALAVAFASNSSGVPVIADWAAALLDEHDAHNYLTFTFRDRDREKYALTVQRVDGLSPQERITALEAELLALKTNGRH